MCCIARLTAAPHAVSLLGLGEDHGRLPFVRMCDGIRRVQFAKVMTAAFQGIHLRRGHVRHKLLELRCLIKEVPLIVDTIIGAQSLILPIHGRRELTQQGVMAVTGKQRVPVGSPQHLDDVPARAGEQRLELLDDLAIAAHRAVEPLQVAVDDKNQIVELLA